MTSNVYGYCPFCGAEVYARERRPNGNDWCGNDHTYPSTQSLSEKPLGMTQDAACDVCGHAVMIDVVVANDVWAAISPSGDEHGYLCANCMVEAIAEKYKWPSVRLLSSRDDHKKPRLTQAGRGVGTGKN